MKQSSIPALSIPGNKMVAVEEIQLKLLKILTLYSTRKCKLDYSFAIKNRKLTLDVDILPLEENHYTVAGGRGARRRRKERRKESVIEPTPRVVEQTPRVVEPTPRVFNQRNTPAAEAKAPRNILQNARLHPKPKTLCGQSSRPALQVPTTEKERSMAEPMKRVEELLNKQNKRIDLNEQPWFFGSISICNTEIKLHFHNNFQN